MAGRSAEGQKANEQTLRLFPVLSHFSPPPQPHPERRLRLLAPRLSRPAEAAAAGDGGELRALELRATRFRWPRELPPDAAPGLRCLALEGAGPSERRRDAKGGERRVGWGGEGEKCSQDIWLAEFWGHMWAYVIYIYIYIYILSTHVADLDCFWIRNRF